MDASSIEERCRAIEAGLEQAVAALREAAEGLDVAGPSRVLEVVFPQRNRLDAGVPAWAGPPGARDGRRTRSGRVGRDEPSGLAWLTIISRVIRRRQRSSRGTLEELAVQTSELVGHLLRENRALRTENAALKVEVERLSYAWEEIKRLARLAPRRRRSRSRAS